MGTVKDHVGGLTKRQHESGLSDSRIRIIIRAFDFFLFLHLFLSSYT